MGIRSTSMAGLRLAALFVIVAVVTCNVEDSTASYRLDDSMSAVMPLNEFVDMGEAVDPAASNSAANAAESEAATATDKAKNAAAASSNSACGPDANPNTCMAHMRKMAADFNRYHAKTTSAMQKQHSAVVIVNKAIGDNKQAVAAVAKTSKVAQTADEKAKTAETELKDANAASNIAEARKESAKTAETDVTNKAQKAAGDAKS